MPQPPPTSDPPIVCWSDGDVPLGLKVYTRGYPDPKTAYQNSPRGAVGITDKTAFSLYGDWAAGSVLRQGRSRGGMVAKEFYL